MDNLSKACKDLPPAKYPVGRVLANLINVVMQNSWFAQRFWNAMELINKTITEYQIQHKQLPTNLLEYLRRRETREDGAPLQECGRGHAGAQHLPGRGPLDARLGHDAHTTRTPYWS